MTAVLISATAALVGLVARALTPGGALAAIGVGAAVLTGTGWTGCLVLVAFFLPSSVVTWIGEPRQPEWVDVRGSRRDAWQVAANGGAAALGALGGLPFPGLGLWIATSALATAAADTWATSVGSFSRHEPVHLLTGKRVPTGTSGGVSLAGTVGGVIGAAVVATAAAAPTGDTRLWWTGVVMGTAGMVADSLFGATLQGRFRCPECGLASERRRHRCGSATKHEGGLRWLGNDGVNAVATTLAGLAGWALWVRWSG